MDAEGLKKAIKEKQELRISHHEQAAQRLYDSIVQEMLQREMYEQEISNGTLKSVLERNGCEHNVETFCKGFLIPKFNKNGFNCAYNSERKSFMVKTP